MTDWYNNNLEIVRIRFGDLAQRLEPVKPQDRVEVINTPRGLPTLFYKDANGKKILLHSRFDPLKEAYQLVADKNLSDVQVIFVLGMGLGYHIEQLRKNPDFSGTIYVIEPSLEVFKAALESRDLNEVLSDTKLQFIVEPDVAKVKDRIYQSVYNYVLKCEFIYLPVYEVLFNDYYGQVLDAINTKATRRICDYFAVDELAKNWESNSLSNLPAILKSVPIESFFDRLKGHPGIIVAAGPSLDKNIHELKPLQSKAVIICVGTVLKPLLDAGIHPHFVIALDASEVILEQFEGVENLEDTWLLSEFCLSPKIVSKFYPRVSFFYAMGYPSLNRLMEKERVEKIYLESGGSVANCALVAATKLGLDPLIFVGQDLCLENDRSHAKGTMHEEERFADKKGINYITLPGNYEKEVTSFRNFFTFLRWTENYINKHPEVEFINATAGGALIKGTRLMSLKELDDRYSHADTLRMQSLHKELLEMIPAGYDRQTISKIKQTLKDLKKLDRFLIEGLSLTNKMAEVISKRKTLSDKEGIRLSAKAEDFFKRLARAEAVSLVDLRVKNDLTLMYCAIESNRIKAKGFNEALLRMPGVFNKLIESSRAIQKGFRKLLKRRNILFSWRKV